MKAVFIDRDGVINQNRRDHVKSWEEFVFLPRAADALVELTRRGFATVVLTNQAVVNRGIASRETIDEIHRRMVAELAAKGARIDGVFYCPHRPEERCLCRKPQPGLLFEAAEKLGVDLSQSYLVGDAMSDVVAGKAAGCRTILVLTGRGLKEFLSPRARSVRGYSISVDLWHAVWRILVEEGAAAAGSIERLRLPACESAARPVVQQLSKVLGTPH